MDEGGGEEGRGEGGGFEGAYLIVGDSVVETTA